MTRFALFPVVAAILAVGLGGCTTMNLKGQTVSSTSRPAMAAAVQNPAPTVAAPIIPDGADFSTAVAMIAQTPGTGVRAIGRAPVVSEPASPSVLALAAIQPDPAPVPKAAPQPERPRQVARSAEPTIAPSEGVESVATADLPPARPAVCDPKAPVIGCIPPTTVLGQPIVAVKRF